MNVKDARMIGTLQVGRAKVVIGDAHDGQHSVEQLADMMLDRLIAVSGEVPGPINDQLIAFKDRARALFIQYLTKAQEIERKRWP